MVAPANGWLAICSTTKPSRGPRTGMAQWVVNLFEAHAGLCNRRCRTYTLGDFTGVCPGSQNRAQAAHHPGCRFAGGQIAPPLVADTPSDAAMLEALNICPCGWATIRQKRCISCGSTWMPSADSRYSECGNQRSAPIPPKHPGAPPGSCWGSRHATTGWMSSNC